MHKLMWIAVVLSATAFDGGQAAEVYMNSAAQRVAVIERAIAKITPVYVPHLSTSRTDLLMRGFVAAELERHRVSFPMRLTLVGQMRYLAERERLEAFLNDEYGERSASRIQYLLRRQGKPLLLTRTGHISPITPEFSLAEAEHRSLVAKLDDDSIVLQIADDDSPTRISTAMVFSNDVVTPESLALALSNEQEAHADLLAYIYNRSADEKEVRWSDLFDERTIYSELSAFIAANVDAAEQDKLQEKEFAEILTKYSASFERWLRKDALLEYVARLIDKHPLYPDYSQHYSLANLPDTPDAWLDGRSQQEVIATALEARRK